MLKILQARLQQYVNCELPDIQAGFRKGRGTRDQTANICWIMEKAREFQKSIYFCFIDYAKAFNCVVPGASVRNSTHDEVMRQSSDGKAKQNSGFLPWNFLSIQPPKIRICLLFHSSDILWKKSIQGFGLLHLKECFNPNTPLMAF